MAFTFKSNISKILDIISEGCRDAVNDTVETIAEDAARIAPRDKGALATSIVALKEGEDHDAARQAAENRAKGKRSDVEFDDGLIVEDYSGEGIHSGAVEVPVSYATLIHNGFADRVGRPFLEEAGNGQESEFHARLTKNISGKLNQ